MGKYKYSCEFGLGVYCCYKTIVPVEHLNDIIKSKNRFHIYSILATPKISIRDIKKDNTGISFKLIKHLGENDEEFEIKNLDIFKLGLDYNKAEIKCKYPNNKLEISFDKDYLKSYYNDFLKDKINIKKSELMQLKKSIIDSQRLFYLAPETRNHQNEMEVLYVGKAYGIKRTRTALERLKAHEKLQKILIECNHDYPHNRIYILLMEINTQIFSTFNGIEKEFLSSEEESEEHLKNVMSNLPIENQVINITEAAIINYFKPKYNVDFVNNFPSTDHSSYRQYFDLDYNKIIVELDMEFNNMPYLKLYTKTNRLDNPFKAIEYNLFNDPNRKDMYDIFRNVDLN
ncbi:hypothetical protein [Clostridium perfringens]|uniref:GIY-YIG domain-containing protein n=2 Tax=Clostridium perfringens TaxID=1502 RepID=B1V2W6_CLOPF|nr:hypothetical protein [Clostridium perfringens]WEV16118.1 hypothetical protein PL325_00240 [Clostridium perfringens D]AQW22411.1 hypothetical protein BXT91_00250 [Clostridium perfringens]EDT71820.1 conserved hypothetical protein [Clostridium perfringens D str. JGS1721]ELC8460547.1 hypothetical protein [Clostridium perfringens]MBO3405221.1 hypothetical protein [Clostridium perfringens]